MRNKRFRKTLSAVLSAALMLQSGFTGFAEEAQPVSETVQETAADEAVALAAQSEAESEAARIAAEQAAQSEAESEAARIAAEQAAQSEAESEAARIAAEQAAQSEAQSEAARTAAEQAAQSEAESEAARTAAEQAAQSEAQTQASTEAPATESQTQASAETAVTESQVQAAATEAQTEEASKEKKDSRKKKKKDKETERSEYENDGEKLSAQAAATGLRYASPYLFAAESVTAAEELLGGKKIAVEDAGTAIVSGLEAFSLELADAKSSSDLEVINLYADEDGKLDEAQLEDLSEDCVIDVSSKYVVVNIIADEADQNLNFAGYEMLLSGAAVKYESGEQPCDIIYNFAAWDDGAFTGYEGTVTLTNNAGLQGVFLAPEAEVNVNSDLAGSVYAKNITVNDSVQKLLKMTFAQSTVAAETESEAAAEVVTEAQSEAETEVAEPVTEKQSETETEVAEPVTEKHSEAETEAVEPVTEKQSEIDTEAVESVTEAMTEASTELVTELGEIVIEAETQEVTEAAETEVQSEVLFGEEELIVEAAAAELYADAQPAATALTDAAVSGFKVSISDADDAAALEGTVTVYAASEIVDAEGVVLYEKDAQVESFRFGADAEQIHEFGTDLTYAGDYYIEVTGLPDGYLAISRIYLKIGAQGITCTYSDWNSADKHLDLRLYKEEAMMNAPVLEVVAEDGTALTGAVFVIKDKDGAVIRNMSENGYPQYYINYTGTPTVLSGLAEGEYILSQIKASDGPAGTDRTTAETEYQVAEDLLFKVSATAVAQLTVVNPVVPSDGKKLSVSAQVYYSTTTENADTKTNVLLTAEENKSYYFAVYTQDTAGFKRISEVQELTIAAGQSDSAASAVPDDTMSGAAGGTTADTAANATAVFTGLADGTYYLAATDEFGMLLDPATISYRLQETDNKVKMTMTPVVIGVQDTEKTAVLQHVYQNGQYPEQEFSYMADVNLTLDVLGRDSKSLSVNETFYASIFGDGELKSALTADPIAIKLKDASTGSAVYQIKMTAAEGTYYIAEVDADGKPITTDSGFAYAVTYPGSETGAFTVSCGQTAQVQIQNKLNDSVVKLSVKSSTDGSYLTGAVLAVKNSSGRVIAVNNTKTFESKNSAIELLNLLEDGKKYYLSEIQAPEGYAASADVQFTVKKGQTTEVVLQNAPAASTDYKLIVSKQVYSGENQVYAYDTTNKAYAKAGAYTFYAALFSDAKHTKKVSDVQEITVSGFSGTTTFRNLKKGKTYYLAETTQYGEVYKSSTSTRTIKYTDGGRIVMAEKSQSAIIQNVYKKLPGGYRYTGTLTIRAQVTDTSDKALAVNSTFYAGIYRKADYSDKPTIIKLEMKNTSSASVKRRILLSGENDMTYYIAQLDANGNRITEDSSFAYTGSIDQPEVAVSKGSDRTVTITNKVKSSKATLYITKKVYEGTELKKVDETFYAGLFKDAEFTQLYTNPIPLKLENKSELTLKLSLNLGTASKATIYVAEVDKDGNVIRNQREFGYEVRIINSTAAFTQEKLEIQTILVNSVYGSTSSDEWDNIYNNEISDSSYSDYSSGYDDSYFSDNGEASYDDSGVDTGDDTPVFLYVILLGGSVVLLLVLLLLRRRRAR